MNEQLIQEWTFYLAAAGYALLAFTAGLATQKVHKKPPVGVRGTGGRGACAPRVAYRFDWDLDRATINGYVGFGIFHGALVGMLLACVTPTGMARFLTILASFVVSVGANFAVWKYPEIAHLKVPVNATGAIALVWIGGKLLGGPGKSGKKSQKKKD